MCTCADEELGLPNAQLNFVQGYGHLQGGCHGEKERESKRERFIIVVLIESTKEFQRRRDKIMENCFPNSPPLLDVQFVSFFAQIFD